MSLARVFLMVSAVSLAGTLWAADAEVVPPPAETAGVKPKTKATRDVRPRVEAPELIKAIALAGDNRLEEAIPLFEEALKKYAKDGYVYGDYAEALADHKRYDDALAVLQRAPPEGRWYARNHRLEARIYIERYQYEQARKVLDDVWQRDPNDPGVAQELAYICEILERWPDAMKLYDIVWQVEAEQSDAHSEAAKASLRLKKEHNPQVQLRGWDINNGADDRRYLELFANYPLVELVEFQSDIWLRDLSGPGMLTVPYVQRTVYDGYVDAILRPGLGLKFTLGVSGAENPAENWAGARAGVGYRMESWYTTLLGVYQEHWTDPVKVVPFAGAEDALTWLVNWSPWDELDLRSIFKLGHDSLRAPPAGLGHSAYDYVSWVGAIEYRFLYVPQMWVRYSFSFLNGDNDDDYKLPLGLVEHRRAHAVGLRLHHDFSQRLAVDAACGIGMDASRDLDLGDLLSYSAGVTYRQSDNLEFRLNHYHGKETTTGSTGSYSENMAEMILRF